MDKSKLQQATEHLNLARKLIAAGIQDDDFDLAAEYREDVDVDLYDLSVDLQDLVKQDFDKNPFVV